MPLTRFALLSLFVLAAARSARADDVTKEQCVASYENAQRLRKASDLVGARAELATCANTSCPDLARQDCVAWLRDVDALMPSILVTARTTAGLDVAGARVFVDDRKLDAPTGVAANVNPGEHTLRVEADGFTPYTTRIVVSEREQSRLLHVELAPAPVLVAHAALRTTHAPFPIAATVFTGVALASLGVGLALDGVGVSNLDDLKRTCGPTCAPSRLDDGKTTLLVGDAFLYGAIAFAAVATILFVIHPWHAAPATATIGARF
ncbi:MAG TPA: PEGA domain-containing protein [Polyangiaceae bacterium]|jgi:hypothetical protein|nr:PEGA domain-containing protein [Polyangiaceae bacterium]